MQAHWQAWSSIVFALPLLELTVLLRDGSSEQIAAARPPPALLRLDGREQHETTSGSEGRCKVRVRTFEVLTEPFSSESVLPLAGPQQIRCRGGCLLSAHLIPPTSPPLSSCRTVRRQACLNEASEHVVRVTQLCLDCDELTCLTWFAVRFCRYAVPRVSRSAALFVGRAVDGGASRHTRVFVHPSNTAALLVAVLHLH